MTNEYDLVYRLKKRAEIRRQISTRKSVQEGEPDRIADLLEEAAAEIVELREKLNPPKKIWPIAEISKLVKIDNEWVPVEKELWKEILDCCEELDPVEGGCGTHCYVETYKIGSWLYNLLFENGQTEPFQITMKECDGEN